MASISAMGLKGCFLIALLVLVSQIDCRGGGGRSGGGGSRSSGGGRSSSYGGSRSSSYGSSHSSHSYGSSHSSGHSYGGSSHSTSHTGGSGHSTGNSGGYHNTGHIGFERFGSGSRPVYTQQTYKPYQPQSVVYSSGRVEYRPPLHQQYTPPATSVHHVYQPVPVYQPVYVKSTSSSSGNAGSFLGGYLVGRLSSSGGYGHNHYYNHHHYYDSSNNNNNDYYYRDDQKNLYTVHHYHQDREAVPSKFSVPGDSTVQCQGETADKLCVPNTHPLCLRNGTIMCVTPTTFTLRCDNTTTTACVYSKIECAGKPPCNVTAGQTYFDFYLPCISNVTLVNDRVFDSHSNTANKNHELCVTAIAEPKKLDSPVSALATLVMELGKYHINSFLQNDTMAVVNTTHTT